MPITREIQMEVPSTEAYPATDEEYDAGQERQPDLAQRYAQVAQARSARAVQAAVVLALGLAAIGVAFGTHSSWLPHLRPFLPHEPDALQLAVTDANGQLNIRWDRSAPAIRSALEGTLEITDGAGVPQAIRLDPPHLATGSFSYVREYERVDVALIVSEPSGPPVKEQTSFLGRLPERGGETQMRKERDALQEKAAKLQKDLTLQTLKTHRTEKELRDALQRHPGDGGKK